MKPMNRQNFLFERDAFLFISHLVPRFAHAASVHKDAGGYWLNVSWNCGVIAPLTIQETHQALGEHHVWPRKEKENSRR